MQTTLWTQWIQERISVRTFDENEMSPLASDELEQYIDEVNLNIKTAAKIQIIRNDAKGEDSQKLGTYGVIKGTDTFIAAIVEGDEVDAVELGFELEKIILFATGLGLGTCWMGGTFNRKDFEQYMALKENEKLVILIAIGYKKERKSLIESTMRILAKSDQRKPSTELFFDQNTDTALDLGRVGDYARVLEMVRIAPSASNKQPWRIIKEGASYHFYLYRTPGYGLMNYDLQLNDIGIAKCHFELAARELGLDGHWAKVELNSHPTNWDYVDSWVSLND